MATIDEVLSGSGFVRVDVLDDVLRFYEAEKARIVSIRDDCDRVGNLPGWRIAKRALAALQRDADRAAAMRQGVIRSVRTYRRVAIEAERYIRGGASEDDLLDALDEVDAADPRWREAG